MEYGKPGKMDLTTDDHGSFYLHGELALSIDPKLSTAEMWHELHAFMNRKGISVDVWFIHEDGRAHKLKEKRAYGQEKAETQSSGA